MMEQDADVIIAGGGPAGMMTGLLLARAGVRVLVLEKHADFLRDFRGDTVHPSTLRLIAEMDLLERFLERPHDKVRRLGVWLGGRHYDVAEFSGFDRRWNFVAFMPQWHFLDFLADEARRYHGFSLTMEAEVRSPVIEAGRVVGVRYRQNGADRTLRAPLVIAADGRRSVLRQTADLPLRSFGVPMDVFWFRLPKPRAAQNESTGIVAPSRIMAAMDRGDYWQLAYVFPKGRADEIRARGLDWFRTDVARTAAVLSPEVQAIGAWDDVKLLTVALDRLTQWQRPGLLAIGDAAHAMSPVGGVGINVAVQDAVAAANILAGPITAGEPLDPLLARVQARRMPAVRATQAMQRLAQGRIIDRVMSSPDDELRPPAALRLLDHSRPLRRFVAGMIGFGFRPEHVRAPLAGSPR